jgi:rubrerythrin
MDNMSGFGFPFGGFVDPDDPNFKKFQEKLKEQHQVMHMQRNDALHEIEDFFQALTGDQLKILMNLFQIGIQGGKNARTTLAIMYGEMQRILSDKEKLCPACLADHNAELAGLTGNGEPEQPPEAKKDLAEFEEATQAALAETAASAAEYNMVLSDEGWKCALCGYSYPSLEDRMLAPKDKCPGCEIKAKWG